MALHVDPRRPYMMRTRFLAIAAVVGVLACDDDSVTDPFAPLALELDAHARER